MTSFPIPDAVLARHIAVLGQTESGKTYDSKSIVEHLVGEGYRVCILDTVKSDWWGLTSSASGKRPGLPFKILGGPRGHVPLHAGAGKPIGELVARGKLPLSIIDMQDFDMGEPQAFFVDFAKALFRNVKGVVYLVIEEAHELAPKERVGADKENMAVYWAKKLATASRTKGIRLLIASQRTQAVHNALLGSCGTMIAHCLQLPADQKPVKDWLKANVADKELYQKIEGDLAFLQSGHAWVCSAKAGYFEKVHFPKIATFDNTATPDKDSGDFDVATAPVDADELRAIIGDAIKQAEANDPVFLKKRIAELEQKLRNPVSLAPLVPAVSTADLTAATWKGFREGFEKGKIAGDAEARVRIYRELVDLFGKNMAQFDGALATAASDLAKASSGLEPTLNAPPMVKPPESAGKAPDAVIRTVEPPSDLPKAMRRVLDAIAWWRNMGIEPVEKKRACIACGLSTKASTFGVYLSKLKELGYIEVESPMVKLTPAGLALANPPFATTNEGLYRVARDILDSQPQKVFELVYSRHPIAVDKAWLAERMNLSLTASTLGVYISKAASVGLLETHKGGLVSVPAWLFPEGGA